MLLQFWITSIYFFGETDVSAMSRITANGMRFWSHKVGLRFVVGFHYCCKISSVRRAEEANMQTLMKNQGQYNHESLDQE